MGFRKEPSRQIMCRERKLNTHLQSRLRSGTDLVLRESPHFEIDGRDRVEPGVKASGAAAADGRKSSEAAPPTHIGAACETQRIYMVQNCVRACSEIASRLVRLRKEELFDSFKYKLIFCCWLCTRLRARAEGQKKNDRTSDYNHLWIYFSVAVCLKITFPPQGVTQMDEWKILASHRDFLYISGKFHSALHIKKLDIDFHKYRLSVWCNNFLKNREKRSDLFLSCWANNTHQTPNKWNCALLSTIYSTVCSFLVSGARACAVP